MIEILNKGYLFFINNNLDKNILKNIIWSFCIKGGNIVIGLILVPMAIDLVNSTQYGFWLTISSVIGWMSFFDIGLGNGLRNKLSEALAINDTKKAKILVSTTYGVIAVISLLLFIILYVINKYMKWDEVLNISSLSSEDIQVIVNVVLGTFCLRLISQLINAVLTSTHKPAIAILNIFLGQLLALIAIQFLKKDTSEALLKLVVILSSSPVIVLITSNIYYYNKELKKISPSINSINFNFIKDTLKLGGNFFIIQIGVILLFQTDNIIITRVLGTNAVTEFNVVNKLYSVIIMIFSTIIIPYWSAFTDAYTRSDFEWMNKSMQALRRTWLLTSLIIVPLICGFSNYIFDLWLDNRIHIPILLSISMGIYTIGYNLISLNCYFLNGIGKIKLQLYLYIGSSIINIPLGIYCAKALGTVGVTLANSIIFFIMGSVLWLQSNKILARRDFGIWSK